MNGIFNRNIFAIPRPLLYIILFLFEVFVDAFDRLICKHFVFDIFLFRIIGVIDTIMWSDMSLPFESN